MVTRAAVGLDGEPGVAAAEAGGLRCGRCGSAWRGGGRESASCAAGCRSGARRAAGMRPRMRSRMRARVLTYARGSLGSIRCSARTFKGGLKNTGRCSLYLLTSTKVQIVKGELFRFASVRASTTPRPKRAYARPPPQQARKTCPCRLRWPKTGLTYAHVCSRMLITYAHVCSRMLTDAHVCSRMLTYAHHVCSRMLTYAHGCSRMLITYAHGCSRMLTYAHGCSSRMLTDAHVCSRMLTYAGLLWCWRSGPSLWT